MADDDGNGNGSEGEGNEPEPKETGKQLRTKLEATLAENATLKAVNLIHESGLSHLSEKQRKAVIRDVQDDGKEISADTLKAAAKDLGYSETPPKPTNEGGEGNEDGEGGDGNEPDPAEEALDGFDAIDRARRQAVPNDDPTSFEHRVKNAKSAQEVEALVRKEGHKVGIVHEWDVD